MWPLGPGQKMSSSWVLLLTELIILLAVLGTKPGLAHSTANVLPLSFILALLDFLAGDFYTSH